ncbi:MAG: SUF system NifU family Fe-S cluster assembly protein [Proteobacteria bacterium]|nr:SUF system NifU family Fe-S cluster assembly protein [Pseudomonadota bacterium]
MNTLYKPGSVDDLSRLYREIILQHSSQPVGFQKVIKETCRNEQFNPLCGDRIVIMLQVEDGMIQDAAFDGESCAICTASASLLCELIPGGLVEEFGKTHNWLEHSLVSNEETAGPQALQVLLGVRKYPSRIECVTLPWTAAAEALLLL